jgi:hypothetical protein
MSDNVIVPIIISIIGACVSVGTFLIAWKKLKPESAVLQGDALDKYNDALDRSAAREVLSQKRWDDREAEWQARELLLMGRLSRLESKYAELDGKLAEATERAVRFERYAYRLAGQVQSMGGVPVAMDPK